MPKLKQYFDYISNLLSYYVYIKMYDINDEKSENSIKKPNLHLTQIDNEWNHAATSIKNIIENTALDKPELPNINVTNEINLWNKEALNKIK